MAHDYQQGHQADQHPEHPQVQHVVRCSCGQELDVCTRSHCPRCGHRINRHAGRSALALVGV